MTISKYIPGEGQVNAFHVPSEVSVAHVTFGAATTADVQAAEIATTVLWTVSRPIVVFGLWAQTETAWTASVTHTIGDSTTADLYMADTTMNPAATSTVLIASTGLSVPYVYAAGQDILLTTAGATAAAGLTNVYIQYALLED